MRNRHNDYAPPIQDFLDIVCVVNWIIICFLVHHLISPNRPTLQTVLDAGYPCPDVALSNNNNNNKNI